MKQKKTQVKLPSAAVAQPLFPSWIIYIVFPVWAAVVLFQYLGKTPLPPVNALFTSSLPGASGALAPRLAEHALHLATAAALFVSAFGAGSLVLRAFRKDMRDDALAGIFLSTALGLGCMALIMLGLGLAGLLRAVPAGAAWSVFFLAGIWSLSRLERPRFPRFTMLEKLLLAVFGCAAAVNLVGSLAPELFFDSQFYQLGVLQKWLVNGRIAPDPYIFQSNYPLNVNMLYLAAMLFGNDITAKLVHFLCGILMAGGLYSFVSKRFSQRAGVLSTVLFYAVPAVMIVSWKSVIELGIGVFELGAVVALIAALESGDLRLTALAGLLCGFSLGSKYTGLVFCFVPAAVAITAHGLSDRAGSKVLAQRLAVFAGCAFLAALPWYLRNFVDTGNPVFPFLSDKIGHQTIRSAGTLLADPPRPDLNLWGYIASAWTLTMGTLQQESFPGPGFLVFLPFVFLFRKIDARVRFLNVYAATACVLWVVFGRFYLRYFVPTLAPVSMILAWYMTEQQTAKDFRSCMALLLAGIASINLVNASGMLRMIQDPWPYVMGRVSRYDYVSTQRALYPCPYYPIVDYANKNIPAGASVLYIGETRGLFARYNVVTHGVSDRSPLVDLLSEAKDADGLRALMAERGITHILLNVPEARRLSSYDMLYFDRAQAEVLRDFWNRYVAQVAAAVADTAVPGRGIDSLMKQRPDWWQGYAADPHNYIYLYRVLSPTEAARPHPVPAGLLFEKEMYAPQRWELLTKNG